MNVDWYDYWRRPPVAESVLANVVGGRYELYSNYPLKIQAVTASIVMWR